MYLYVTDQPGEGNYTPIDRARIIALNEAQQKELEAGSEIYQIDGTLELARLKETPEGLAVELLLTKED